MAAHGEFGQRHLPRDRLVRQAAGNLRQDRRLVRCQPGVFAPHRAEQRLDRGNHRLGRRAFGQHRIGHALAQPRGLGIGADQHDPRIGPARTQEGQGRQAIDPFQPDIEQDQVGRGAIMGQRGFGSRHCHTCRAGKVALDQHGDPRAEQAVIVDDQDILHPNAPSPGCCAVQMQPRQASLGASGRSTPGFTRIRARSASRMPQCWSSRLNRSVSSS